MKGIKGPVEERADKMPRRELNYKSCTECTNKETVSLVVEGGTELAVVTWCCCGRVWIVDGDHKMQVYNFCQED